MNHASYAALVAALVTVPLAGCASVPLPAPVVSSIETACAGLPIVAAGYNLIKGFLPASTIATADVALTLLESDCANPPADIETALADVEAAIATLEHAISAGSARAHLSHGQTVTVHKALARLHAAKVGMHHGA